MTWSWEALFALYILADEYDTALSRQHVIEVTQTNALQLRPRVYPLPHPEAITTVANNLPANSPLYRFLVLLMVEISSENRGADHLTSPFADLAIIPSDVLAEVYRASNAALRHVSAIAATQQIAP